VLKQLAAEYFLEQTGISSFTGLVVIRQAA